MQREIIDLPPMFGSVLRDWHIDTRGRSAGDGVTGDGQVVYANRAKWSAKLDINLMKRDRVMVWGAIMAKMRGRVNLLRVRVCDPFRVTARDLGIELSGAGLPHGDDAFFEDDSGYLYAPTAPILGAAPAGATTLLVNATAVADKLAPGHFFSIADWLYRCTGISGSGGATTITFEPPLRRPVTAADEVNLDAVAVMAFESDAEGRAQLAAGRYGSATLNLVEWTNR